MTYSLAGKRAIVTGAAGGIGRQTATQLAAAGAAVYINDIDADAIAEARTAIPGLAGEVTDMGDPAAIKTFFGRAVEHLGGLDILINNVGSAGPTAPVEEVTLAEWNTCLAVNLTSAFLCVQEAVPYLRAAGGGAIVNMSSAAGKFGFPLRSPYASAKWAIVGFTRTLALALARRQRAPCGLTLCPLAPRPGTPSFEAIATTAFTSSPNSALGTPITATS
ncbi:MAG: SDR family NAD(P)-dependent oxidoreductase [Alphaproteobacteria bacterium]|nr:SDR family NAD(P)-dependent oxidoreductase [Alphaproteobacteria bacterium]